MPQVGDVIENRFTFETGGRRYFQTLWHRITLQQPGFSIPVWNGILAEDWTQTQQSYPSTVIYTCNRYQNLSRREPLVTTFFRLPGTPPVFTWNFTTSMVQWYIRQGVDSSGRPRRSRLAIGPLNWTIGRRGRSPGGGFDLRIVNFLTETYVQFPPGGTFAEPGFIVKSTGEFVKTDSVVSRGLQADLYTRRRLRGIT